MNSIYGHLRSVMAWSSTFWDDHPVGMNQPKQPNQPSMIEIAIAIAAINNPIIDAFPRRCGATPMWPQPKMMRSETQPEPAWQWLTWTSATLDHQKGGFPACDKQKWGTWGWVKDFDATSFFDDFPISPNLFAYFVVGTSPIAGYIHVKLFQLERKDL